ncbi:tRNA1(Val) (adenine(37)-N6)-methyltransferase [Chryseosolibacter indicus]|uniref:tRNA1(Val) (adenine(37)-N6)-methyltransferase n=1 Tax=Chryseosolibacter indicus TaxID=2782351 RepID=A0ABS5VZA3_9BACT|nr:methyltransferase [Chryseosolibacter indicus]MBT1706403.1 methyltransferase [Chryseosolibacter indicus]
MKKTRDFNFKKFTVSQDRATHKVGTDGVLLGAWTNIINEGFVLDIGTGTGLIALMLAQRTTPNVIVHAVELQKEDAEQARANVNQSPWKDRIMIHNQSIQEFKPEIKFDLIVSNPPYFINSALPPAMERSIVRHTQSLNFEELMHAAKRLIQPSGRLAVILPWQESQVFKNISGQQGFHCIRECAFRSRANKPFERALMEFSQQQSFKVTEELVLHGEGEQWSDEYKQLTKDFYLKI